MTNYGYCAIVSEKGLRPTYENKMSMFPKWGGNSRKISNYPSPYIPYTIIIKVGFIFPYIHIRSE